MTIRFDLKILDRRSIFTTYGKMYKSKRSRKRVLRDGCSILNLNSTYIQSLFRAVFTDIKEIKETII